MGKIGILHSGRHGKGVIGQQTNIAQVDNVNTPLKVAGGVPRTIIGRSPRRDIHTGGDIRHIKARGLARRHQLTSGMSPFRGR